MPRLSKSRLQDLQQCPKRLWLQVRHPELREDSAVAQLVFAAGHRVGEVARTLAPGGTLIDPRVPGTDRPDLAEALRLTRELLAAAPRRPLYEATFERDGVLVRADLLLPAPGGWRLAEVKSTSSVRDYHLADVAIQRWVLQGQLKDDSWAAGPLAPLAGVELWHVNTGWTWPGGPDYAGLFVREDLTAATEPLLDQVPRWVREAERILQGNEPAIAMGEQCRTPFDCPFQAHCAAQAGPQPKYPVTLLPNTKGKKLAAQLLAEGFDDLRSVPPERIEDPELAMIARVTREGAPLLEPQAAKSLNRLGWPRAYLDFETIGFAVPQWPGTRPYQQLPFQWSCQIEDGPPGEGPSKEGPSEEGPSEEGQVREAAFLDLSGADPRRACAEALARELPAAGPVIVYNAGFERSVLRALAGEFPDLARPLNRIARRLVDLLPLVRAHYYHPDMRGSRSIKAVLPTIPGGADYGLLDEVQHGAAAQAAYLEAIDPETGEARRAELEGALRRYCAMDTWAMVALARFLASGK